MRLTLKRASFTEQGIFGYLFDEQGNQIAVTLERAFPVPGSGLWQPAVISGLYTCQRRRSPRFRYDVFMLLDVPGHDFVEIHKGNWEENSTGCILLGTTIDGSMITESKIAFYKFMALLAGQDSFDLLIK